ncbi:unnamed protein product [Caenorhabditis nigoni]
MKTKQPKTTTIAPYFDEFNFEDDNTVPSYENELQFLSDYQAVIEDFGRNTLAYYQFLSILDEVYKYATYFSFCVNLFHLFILTRKELRTNLVYIIMIGICLCDLIQASANILQYVLLWNIVYKIDQCYDGYKYAHVVVNLIAKTTQIMSRRCVFEVVADPTSLNIQGGTDKCDAKDDYCLKIDFNGIKAKGCSRTSHKIGGVGMVSIDCTKSGCFDDGAVCCCEGNKCNGVSEMSAMLPVVIIGAARFFL